jgi:hypothetical protein
MVSKPNRSSTREPDLVSRLKRTSSAIRVTALQLPIEQGTGQSLSMLIGRLAYKGVAFCLSRIDFAVMLITFVNGFVVIRGLRCQGIYFCWGVLGKKINRSCRQFI